mmetsp:Transcript_125758/g.245179  ORF Transcript_125758/g.245179 Transcript_125758/m.245179 type:complete len:815 (-) Transcript_125758:74-2518(-)
MTSRPLKKAQLCEKTRINLDTRAEKDWDEEAALWPCRMHEVRKWGQALNQKGGSDAGSSKRILTTIGNLRSASEGALRRTAIEALVPAAAVGHRSAIAAQAAALGDESEAVRRSAVRSLQAAAGLKRAESGGAVSVALSEAFAQPGQSQRDMPTRRTQALVLKELAPKGDKDMVIAATAFSQDKDSQVRRTAVEALGAIGTSKADVRAVAGLVKDPDGGVARAAVEALEQLAGIRPHPASGSTRGLNHALGLTTGSSFHGESVASSSATIQHNTSLESFASTKDLDATMSDISVGSPSSRNVNDDYSDQGSQFGNTLRSNFGKRSATTRGKKSKQQLKTEAAAMEALATCCREEGVVGLPRALAVAALGRSVGSNSSVALEAAVQNLAGTDEQVRREAVAAVGLLAPSNRQLSVQMSAGQLTNADFRVRGAARKALVQAANDSERTKAFAIGRAAAALEAPEWAGRRGTALALRKLGELGGSEGQVVALRALLPRLRHTSWSIRCKALECVAEVGSAHGGNELAVEMLADAITDPDEEVRRSAVRLLPRAAPQKSKRAVEVAATVSTSDPHVDIRVEALAALEGLVSEGRSRSRVAVHAVIRCYEDSAEEVRNAAERVMATLFMDRRTAVDALAALLSHQQERVQLAAVRALKNVSADRRSRAQRHMVKLMRHPNEVVRNAARHGMEAASEAHESIAVTAAASILGRLRRNRFGQATLKADAVPTARTAPLVDGTTVYLPTDADGASGARPSVASDGISEATAGIVGSQSAASSDEEFSQSETETDEPIQDPEDGKSHSDAARSSVSHATQRGE